MNLRKILYYMLVGIFGITAVYASYHFFLTDNLIKILSIEKLNTEYIPLADMICYTAISILICLAVWFYRMGQNADASSQNIFRLMMITTCFDKEVTESELKVLKRAALTLGVSTRNLEQDLDELKNQIASGKSVSFKLDKAEKERYLKAMKKVIEADSKLSLGELHILTHASHILGISREEIDAYVTK